MQAEIFWLSLRFADVEYLPNFINNVTDAVHELDRMDPEDARIRQELTRNIPDRNPGLYAIMQACVIDWSRYVSNKVYQHDFELWPAANSTLDNVQSAALRVSKAAGLWKELKDIVQESNVEEEEIELYRVFLEVHELHVRFQTEELEGATE